MKMEKTQLKTSEKQLQAGTMKLRVRIRKRLKFSHWGALTTVKIEVMGNMS